MRFAIVQLNDNLAVCLKANISNLRSQYDLGAFVVAFQGPDL